VCGIPKSLNARHFERRRELDRWGQLRSDCGVLRIRANGLRLEYHPFMSRPTVLIVDDEPLARWSASETLTDAGYRVTEAGDAETALRAMTGRDSQVDVVLLDLLLPDADDLKVLSAMREAAPETPIILMTSYGSRELFAEARERGAFMSVNKPFEMGDLPNLVAQALQP
jgi:DNA-binding NtrC family response regulator